MDGFAQDDRDCDESEFRKGRLAVVQDGSGYWAALKCREDFGCVLFQPRTQA